MYGVKFYKINTSKQVCQTARLDKKVPTIGPDGLTTQKHNASAPETNIRIYESDIKPASAKARGNV